MFLLLWNNMGYRSWREKEVGRKGSSCRRGERKL